MKPICPNTHSFDKSNCECIKKKKRCANGTRRDKVTGKCIANSTRKANPRTRKASPIHQSRRRKLRLKDAPVATPNKKSVTIDENIIKGAINEAVQSKDFAENKLKVLLDPNPRNLEVQQRDFIASLQRSLVNSGSFSPAINNQLVSLKNGAINPLFACGAVNAFAESARTAKGIQVGVLTKTGYRCISYTTKTARDAMMSTFKANKPIVCTDLIMPIQGYNNCWFNTWFAVFFVSDKGRKFFRYLRQYMITGKKIDGQLIKPKALANALKLLNLCIEATYNNSGLADPALVINTNSIIDFLHASIEKLSVKLRGERKGLPQLGKYANPINFYNILSSYLSDNIIKLSIVSKLRNVEHSEGKIIRVKEANNMDVILVRTWENIRGREDSIASSNFIAPLSFTTSDSKFEFVMDSVIVRDIKGIHFVALLTCNGNEFGYDGLGFTSIKPFKWKELLSSKKQWKIPGSKVTCSFTQSYCEYFYYKK